MENLKISRVSFGDSLINQQAIKSVATEPKQDNNKLSDNAKIMIGLGALSTAILGGLLAHKCFKFNKLAKDNVQLNKLCTDYKNNFIEACQSLVCKGKECKTAGKTIEESIANIYGKDCNIKPHTYDKSQEYLIETLENENGFFTRLIAPNNKYYKEGFLGSKLSCENMEVIKDGSPVKGEISIKTGVNKYGQKCIELFFPSHQKGSDDIQQIVNAITIISKDGNLTPVQKDILKLKDKTFTEVDKELLKDLVLTTYRGEKAGFQGNYDAILSVIQHLANG